uniref:Putative transcriptional regulator n=1 Tax=Ixodes ricinus TaxID=34613 RepID=V5HAU4_IXORI
MFLKTASKLAASTVRACTTPRREYRSATLLCRAPVCPHASGPQGPPHAFESRQHAGHSHWQNVRHIKAAKDAHKMSQTDKFVRLIQAAVKAGGGPDPKLNRVLANAIENARRTQVVTNAAIELAIKRASGAEKPKNLRKAMYEIIMEHGVLLLVDVETPNISRFGNEIKIICKKHTCRISRGGVKEQFLEKGFVRVSGREDGAALDSDAALDVAIQHGAEDVFDIDDGEKTMCEFLCDVKDYFALSKALTTNGYVVEECGNKFVPMVPVTISEEHMGVVGRLCDELEEHSDVVAVHTNIA